MVAILVVGLGKFGAGVVDELHEIGAEIAVLDMDKQKVERVRDRAAISAVVDVQNLNALEKVIPEGIQVVIIDCGGKDNPFLNVLLAHYYHNKMIPRIVALAYSREHAEILRLVGATEAVEPEKESARRVARSVSRPNFGAFLPISEDFAVAEVIAPKEFWGKTLDQLGIRKKYGLAVVAFKYEYAGKQNYRFPDASDAVDENTTIVVVGPQQKILKFP